MPWETCKRFTACCICKKVMVKGDARLSYTEVGRQVYWKVTRHICVSCAEKKFGRDIHLGITLNNKCEEQNAGTVKRLLRPIINEMKGE